MKIKIMKKGVTFWIFANILQETWDKLAVIYVPHGSLFEKLCAVHISYFLVAG